MNKQDIVTSLYTSSYLSKDMAECTINIVFNLITDALKKGQKISILGFGSFWTSEKPERTFRNIRTKELYTVPAKRSVRFKAGKDLDNYINRHI